MYALYFTYDEQGKPFTLSYDNGSGVLSHFGDNVGPIVGRIGFGSLGFVLTFKNGELEFGAAVLVGFTVSADNIWIIELLDD